MKPLEPSEAAAGDCRLYLPYPDGWTAQVWRSWDKQYCYAKNPGDEHFHLIMHGEIYLESSEKKVCLQCALRDGIVSTDRLNWQHRDRSKKSDRL